MPVARPSLELPGFQPDLLTSSLVVRKLGRDAVNGIIDEHHEWSGVTRFRKADAVFAAQLEIPNTAYPNPQLQGVAALNYEGSFFQRRTGNVLPVLEGMFISENTAQKRRVAAALLLGPLSNFSTRHTSVAFNPNGPYDAVTHALLYGSTTPLLGQVYRPQLGELMMEMVPARGSAELMGQLSAVAFTAPRRKPQ